MRGFSCISLHNPKTPENVGGVLRAAFAYGVSQVNIAGNRTCWEWVKHPTNTIKANRHIPIFRTAGALDYVPGDTQIVVVDLVDEAAPLMRFRHPERALYVFGPEDGTVPREIIRKAQHKVYVPTRTCMNLAATVNVVLYDRLSKRGVDFPAYSHTGQNYRRNGEAAR